MNKIYSFVISLIIISTFFQGTALACWGFRPMGMGGTFVAVADDANCAYWNRAGAGQLDKWKNGENQIVLTSRILDDTGFFNREGRIGNTYYDSINLAHKINENTGWALAAEWSGGESFAFSPSVGFRLPWNDTMSLGIGYFYYRTEGYGDPFGTQVRTDTVQNEIHLDYLWRITKEWSFGVHCENFWLLSGITTSPDIPGWKEEFSAAAGQDVNVRPSIAWMPEGRLKGLVVNAGIYDLCRSGGGPFYSAGLEYTPPAINNVESFWSRSSFRAGVYNYKSTPEGALTLGYGYKTNDRLEIGYFGFFWITPNGIGQSYDHNLGVAVKF